MPHLGGGLGTLYGPLISDNWTLNTSNLSIYTYVGASFYNATSNLCKPIENNNTFVNHLHGSWHWTAWMDPIEHEMDSETSMATPKDRSR